MRDPSTRNPGQLVNGAFWLPQPLRARASSLAGTGAAYAGVGASALTLLTYAGPVSDDLVTLGFSQGIGANDALRTGTYSKTLEFTLSATDGSCSLSLTVVPGVGPPRSGELRLAAGHGDRRNNALRRGEYDGRRNGARDALF